MDKKIRVAILDDHQSIIDGYTFRLNQTPDIEVVATALFGEDLDLLLAREPVDVLLLDISLPMSPENPNPFHAQFAIAKLTERYPDLHILVISMHETRRLIETVIASGASGYILKDDQKAFRDLGAIIRLVASGGRYFSEKAFILIQQKEDQDMILSPRQLEALSLCASYPDATSKELASMMCVADPTVRNLLSKAYERMGVRSRGAAVAKARSLGLIP